MTSKVVQRLVVSQSGCGDIRLTYRDLQLALAYEFRENGTDSIGHMNFLSVIAFRFSDELHSCGFVPGSYDQVMEIVGSKWLEELRAGEPVGTRGVSGKHHYAVLLSSNGYLEVIADGVAIEEPSEGSLGEGDVG